VFPKWVPGRLGKLAESREAVSLLFDDAAPAALRVVTDEAESRLGFAGVSRGKLLPVVVWRGSLLPESVLLVVPGTAVSPGINRVCSCPGEG
jgi:hypothetical protein